jgi:hypothetical protein
MQHQGSHRPPDCHPPLLLFLRRNVFDIPLLAQRLQLAAGWLRGPGSRVPAAVPLGFFGASTGGSGLRR